MEAASGALNRSCVPRDAAEQQPIECPSCKEKLCPYEMPRHCEEEMERLKQMETTRADEITTLPSTDEERRKPWTVFRRVQRNRQTRLRQRSRKFTTPTPPPPPKDYPCPLCNERFSNNDIQRHTEECLRRSNGGDGGDDNSSNDDDDGEEYEEYEWAGQKRIRVSSLLRGGYASIGVGQVTHNHNNSASHNQQHQEDDDEDLNVDEDDTEIYGPAQYGENDIIVGNGAEENGSDVTSYMRRLITEGDSSAISGGGGTNQQVLDSARPCDTDESNIPHDAETPTIDATAKQQQDQVIEALKAKLRHYENHVQSKFCKICLDDYRNPAISVSCWHVHCEQCWLRSLGARKLCPQCNLITTPKDLRRIYM